MGTFTQWEAWRTPRMIEHPVPALQVDSYAPIGAASKAHLRELVLAGQSRSRKGASRAYGTLRSLTSYEVRLPRRAEDQGAGAAKL
jgi:hypothetical protein